MDNGLLNALLPQVSTNCLVSDARYWGYYSTCGLLLRLRELYRSEHSLPPGEPVDKESILEWIALREARWTELENAELGRIELDGTSFDPYDTEGINRALDGTGLIYGAGMGNFMKPVFFLAELLEARKIEGCKVFVAGREHARDLSVNPALARSGTILVRRELSAHLLYSRFEEFMASRNKDGPLGFAFRSYGIEGPSPDPERFEALVGSETEAYVHHETGELRAEAAFGLNAILTALPPHGRVPAGLRGLKDALADTLEGGMISHIIRGKKAGSLGFLIASLTGLRYILESPVRKAFDSFRQGAGWDVLEQARLESASRAVKLARELSSLRTEDNEELARKAEALLACPAQD
jgi:hypothetical protein